MRITGKRGVDHSQALFCALLLAPLTASPQEAENQQGEAIVVTGSRLGLAADQSVDELLIFDRSRLEQSGQSTVADFLGSAPLRALLIGPGRPDGQRTYAARWPHP